MLHVLELLSRLSESTSAALSVDLRLAARVLAAGESSVTRRVRAVSREMSSPFCASAAAAQVTTGQRDEWTEQGQEQRQSSVSCTLQVTESSIRATNK